MISWERPTLGEARSGVGKGRGATISLLPFIQVFRSQSCPLASKSANVKSAAYTLPPGSFTGPSRQRESPAVHPLCCGVTGGPNSLSLRIRSAADARQHSAERRHARRRGQSPASNCKQPQQKRVRQRGRLDTPGSSRWEVLERTWRHIRSMEIAEPEFAPVFRPHCSGQD